MKVKINKTHPDAITPTYGSKGAACFDLYAIEGGSILPGEAVTFDTGIAFEIPAGHYMHFTADQEWALRTTSGYLIVKG